MYVSCRVALLSCAPLLTLCADGWVIVGGILLVVLIILIAFIVLFRRRQSLEALSSLLPSLSFHESSCLSLLLLFLSSSLPLLPSHVVVQTDRSLQLIATSAPMQMGDPGGYYRLDDTGDARRRPPSQLDREIL